MFHLEEIQGGKHFFLAECNTTETVTISKFFDVPAGHFFWRQLDNASKKNYDRNQAETKINKNKPNFLVKPNFWQKAKQIEVFNQWYVKKERTQTKGHLTALEIISCRRLAAHSRSILHEINWWSVDR